jgi:hypothetical protein
VGLVESFEKSAATRARQSKAADKFASQRSSITPEAEVRLHKPSPLLLIFADGCHIVRAFSGIRLGLDELTME